MAGSLNGYNLNLHKNAELGMLSKGSAMHYDFSQKAVCKYKGHSVMEMVPVHLHHIGILCLKYSQR